MHGQGLNADEVYSATLAKLDLTYLSYIGDKRRSTEAGDPDKRETAFDQLVLDPNHKRVLQSLVAQHYRDKQSPSSANEQVDIVRGKGMPFITSWSR
jgi:hypothetical protein